VIIVDSAQHYSAVDHQQYLRLVLSDLNKFRVVEMGDDFSQARDVPF